MKRLTVEDLDAYKGVLPYASEVYGIYQPLLGWKSVRAIGRIAGDTARFLGDTLRANPRLFLPKYQLQFNAPDCFVQIDGLEPAVLQDDSRHFADTVLRSVGESLPDRDKVSEDTWEKFVGTEFLAKVLDGPVTERATSLYRDACQSLSDDAEDEERQRLEMITEAYVSVESQVAGALSYLRESGRYNVLDAIFYGAVDQVPIVWNALGVAASPFRAFDPTNRLDRVSLSPVGLAHLFRQYFFELDSFVGSPVGHIWLSGNSTVELVEVHTRRELTEQTVEQALETTRRSEQETRSQDDLAEAVKQENKSDIKLGVNVSVKEQWGWGSADESASFGYETTQSRSREQSHKAMRQQSTKLSTEIKENFKTTFRTVTETTDTSTKRYVLSNPKPDLVNYELRRKMRHVAVQVQDIGSYLCWQTYVDDPGRDLGLSRLVHIGTPPDLSKVPVPKLIAPPGPLPEPHEVQINFWSEDGGSKDEDYDFGFEADAGNFDPVNSIAWVIPAGPFRCSQAGYILKEGSVTLDPHGADALLAVDEKSIKEDPPNSGAWTFNILLLHINFKDADSVTIEATLNWQPKDDPAAQASIDEQNKAIMQTFTARELEVFRAAYIEESRTRINAAGKVHRRRAEDLREEERIVVYRRLIQEMLAPESKVPQPSPQSQHVVAELLNSIFDVDRLLYFVAPEWWRPRRHSGQQQLDFASTIDATGKPIGLHTTTGPKLVTVGGPGAPPPAPPPPPIRIDETFSWGFEPTRRDNYFITEDSEPAPLGSSLGWLLQLDGDDFRNAFLNSPWVKAVLPIRPGKERAALDWLAMVEGTNGIGPKDLYDGPEPEWNDKKTVLEVLEILADRIASKHHDEIQTSTFADPLDNNVDVHATPVDRVYEHGFDPLLHGFRNDLTANTDFEIFDQWIEILPTDQVVAVEVKYDPKTGRQI